MKRSFSSITVNGTFADRGLPVLLICNHISWWDGIWALYLNKKILNRKFHFMMLEEQLQKNWFFKYTGGFSVAKKSRTILETIDYTAELLLNPKNVVLMFPQGDIRSMHLHKIRFEKGIRKILEKSKPVHILMVANFIDYFSKVKPGLNIFFEEYSGDTDLNNIELAYNNFFEKCIQLQQAKSE